MPIEAMQYPAGSGLGISDITLLSTRNESITAGSFGFSANSTMFKFWSTFITPRLGASERGIGLAAIVISAPSLMWAFTIFVKSIW